MTFIDILKESSKKTNTVACVGFDPLIEKIDNLKEYFFDIIELMRTKKLVPAAFKPNIGYFATFGSFDNPSQGLQDLNEIIAALQTNFPDIPIIFDSKRGDIARSSANYAQEAFNVYRANAVTVSPYMGSDSLAPFVAQDKAIGVYVLNRTSNSGGADIQNLQLADGRFLYEAVSELIIEYNKTFALQKNRFGAVVGATNLKEMADICTIFKGKDIPLLIPGVGGQGARAEDVLHVLDTVGIPRFLTRINNSSKICFPYEVVNENGVKKRPKNYMQLIEQSLKDFLAVCRI